MPCDFPPHKTSGGPRRILALSGGGVRGIVEVAFLEAVESVYQRRHGPQTRLCDVFDLVGGTSTGALIATAVSLGTPMPRIRDFYLERAAQFFRRKRWWRIGRAPIFDCDGLEAEFRREVGDITLGDPALQTLLAIIIKRFDTGSAWIVNNIPTSPYFDDPPDGSFRGNRHFQLARLLRASTAAPLYFSQELIELGPDGQIGVFMDGGLSPYNDPSLALLQLAGMRAFGLNWRLDAESMFVLSVGAGRARQRIATAKASGMRPYRALPKALGAMMRASEQHSLTMMEWMGTSPAPSPINSEVGTLESDTLGGKPLFTFLRLDLPLEPGEETGLTEAEARWLGGITDPDLIRPLYERAAAHAEKAWDLQALLR